MDEVETAAERCSYMHVLLYDLLIASIESKDLLLLWQVGIHPSAAEEFVTMRSITRRVAAGTKLKTNL